MPSNTCAIGVDLGGQSVKLAVVDDAGAILLRRQAGVDASRPEPEIRSLILNEIAAIHAEAASAKLDPARVGMVMPGYLDRDRTRVLFAANLPTLNDTDFLGSIRASLDLAVAFDADSNAAALAEYRFGAGRGVDRLIVAAIGTGIGAGVIIDGQILRIWNHIAGSLGHVIIDPRGPKCACGATGCIEALASGPALERRAAETANSNPKSKLAALLKPPCGTGFQPVGFQVPAGGSGQAARLTGIDIAQALHENDPAAVEAVRETGWWLGAGIAAWCVIFRPSKVLIGGGIAAIGESLLVAAREALAQVGQPSATRNVEIAAAALGPDAGVIGAAALAGQSGSAVQSCT